jgi:hypothetical protein
MSKINILGIVKNIKSKTNVYTPIIEAVNIQHNVYQLIG